MADAWTWSAAHNDYYHYTNEHGNWIIHWAKQSAPKRLERRDSNIVESSSEDPFSGPQSLSSTKTVSNSNYTASGPRYTNIPPYSSIHPIKSIPDKVESPTITPLARDCLKLFGKICEDLRNQQQENKELILRISNELDRFRLWMISFDVESGKLDERALLSLSTSQLLLSQLRSIARLLKQYNASIGDYTHSQQDDHYITHIRHAISSLLELSPVLELALDNIEMEHEGEMEPELSDAKWGNQITKPNKATDASTSQIQLGPQYCEAPINDWYYTPANQGYDPPSISAHYTVNQAYSTAPNYSSGDRAYAGSTSRPTPQAAEQQSPPDQRRPYAYQRDQYGQSQQEYFITTSGWPTADRPSEEIPPSAIRGTPGEVETLDPEYRVQNSGFFERGKMFAILFSEPLGNDTQQLDNANLSTVIYSESVYCQIGRFVVVQERRGFCYACPIFTYGGRATTKSGVEPSEHAIIYIQGTRPRLVRGEATLEKKSIAVLPAGSGIALAPASRINFGIQHPIQHNVKVKDLGTVCDEDIPYLIGYARMERDRE